MAEALRATQSRFVTSLCGLPQFRVELVCRCVKFNVKCLSSSNSVVRHVVCYLFSCCLFSKTAFSNWSELTPWCLHGWCFSFRHSRQC